MSLLIDFKTRFPNFDTAKVDAAWPAIDQAYLCYFGVEYGLGTTCEDQIILVLCAHLFTLESTTGTTPRLAATSKSVGNVSTSYAVGDVSSYRSFFMSSKYGQQFVQMTNGLAQGAIFV